MRGFAFILRPGIIQSMLYLIYGSDREKARAKKDELLTVLHGKRPDAEVFILTEDNFTIASLESLYSSQGLFEQKHIAVLDGLFTNKDMKQAVLGSLPQIASALSAFLIFEGVLDAKTAGAVEKHSAKTFSFGEKKKEEKDGTAFLIPDALLAKDRRGAWVKYQKALRRDIAPEAIHGALFWKIKTALLAKKTGGWNRDAKNFSEEELDEMLFRLVSIYHDIRLEGGEMETELEKFILVK